MSNKIRGKFGGMKGDYQTVLVPSHQTMAKIREGAINGDFIIVSSHVEPNEQNNGSRENMLFTLFTPL